MKLIDIFVRDLHKFGGWPNGAVECHRFVDEANIDFYDADGEWQEDCFIRYGNFAQEAVRKSITACESESVTKEQYDEAIAATKRGWDGVGFPPVGCECEFFDCEKWLKVTMLYGGSQLVVLFDHDNQIERSFSTSRIDGKFRPIRSEAERKRDEAVKEFVRQLIECVDLHAMDERQEAIVREKLYSMLPTLPGVTVND